MSDKKEIGAWLLAFIRENGERRTYQTQAVRAIREKFGEEWSYRNHNGNWAIDKGVLAEFGKLRDEFIEWDRSDQSWRVLTPEKLEWKREREARRAESKAETKRLIEEARKRNA
jgi:hypothetical protein